jgi:hypothetical protein
MRAILIGLFVIGFCSGCQNPQVVQISPNIYVLAREDHGGIFGNASALRANVIKDANAFAAKQGKVALPVCSKFHPVGILGDWASFEYQFKLVDTNSVDAKNISKIETDEKVVQGDGTLLRPERYSETQYKIVVSTNQP